MDNPRPEKVAVVDEVRGHFNDADAAILTEYRGLKVKDLAVLRRSLRANGGEYRIYKNTLVRFATRELGLHELDGMLEGPTAIAFVKGDAAAAAKTLRDYSRTNNLLVIKGGVLGDKVLSSSDTAALAELPSRDVLLARIAGGLAAPIQQLAGLLQALPRNFAYGLAALRDARVAGGEVVAEEVVASETAEQVAAEPDVLPVGETVERGAGGDSADAAESAEVPSEGGSESASSGGSESASEGSEPSAAAEAPAE